MSSLSSPFTFLHLSVCHPWDSGSPFWSCWTALVCSVGSSVSNLLAITLGIEYIRLPSRIIRFLTASYLPPWTMLHFEHIKAGQVSYRCMCSECCSLWLLLCCPSSMPLPSHLPITSSSCGLPVAVDTAGSTLSAPSFTYFYLETLDIHHEHDGMNCFYLHNFSFIWTQCHVCRVTKG